MRRGQSATTTEWKPVVTYGLIAINVVIYLITAVQSGSFFTISQSSPVFSDLALVPGAVAGGQYGRIFGSAFLHFGLLHIAVNMYALYIVGRDCEFILGRARFIALYGVSLLGGSMLVMFGAFNVMTAGASAAIFGLFGAEAVILIRLRRNPTVILAVIALNVVISLTLPGISILGHLGGLVTGTIGAVGLMYAPKILEAVGDHQPSRRDVRTVGWTVLGACYAVVIALIIWRIMDLRATFGL